MSIFPANAAPQVAVSLTQVAQVTNPHDPFHLGFDPHAHFFQPIPGELNLDLDEETPPKEASPFAGAGGGPINQFRQELEAVIDPSRAQKAVNFSSLLPPGSDSEDDYEFQKPLQGHLKASAAGGYAFCPEELPLALGAGLFPKPTEAKAPLEESKQEKEAVFPLRDPNFSIRSLKPPKDRLLRMEDVDLLRRFLETK